MTDKKKTRAITTRKEKRELVFAGATSLMGVDPKKLGPAEVAAHKARTLVARALGIPPNTVVIMGNVPYVDNHGRKQKMGDYAPRAQFEYDYVQIATDDTMKAIVKCRIVEIDYHGDDPIQSPVKKPLCGWVIGECSPLTTRMSTLKGYQNHLAQTRAENRAFEAAFGTKFRSDLYAGIARELGVKDAGEAPMDQVPVAELALQAGNTSAEEAVDMRPAGKQQPLGFDPFKNAQNAIAQAFSTKALESLRGRVKGSKNFVPEQVNRLLEQINEKIATISAGS